MKNHPPKPAPCKECRRSVDTVWTERPHSLLAALLVLIYTALVLPAAADPILANGGFDKALAPWECEEGKLAPDPEKDDNPVLEITLEDGVFGLSQDIRWPAEKKELTLAFRIRASKATAESPVQLRVRIYDKDGNSELTAGFIVKKSGEWVSLKSAMKRPGFEPVSFMLESNRGEGTLWIDDLTLK